jgi:hypothetical protein
MPQVPRKKRRGAPGSAEPGLAPRTSEAQALQQGLARGIAIWSHRCCRFGDATCLLREAVAGGLLAGGTPDRLLAGDQDRASARILGSRSVTITPERATFGLWDALPRRSHPAERVGGLPGRSTTGSARLRFPGSIAARRPTLEKILVDSIVSWRNLRAGSSGDPMQGLTHESAATLTPRVPWSPDQDRAATPRLLRDFRLPPGGAKWRAERLDHGGLLQPGIERRRAVATYRQRHGLERAPA